MIERRTIRKSDQDTIEKPSSTKKLSVDIFIFRFIDIIFYFHFVV